MQCLLYVSLGLLMFLMDEIAGANHTLDHLFQYHVSDSSLLWLILHSFQFVMRINCANENKAHDRFSDDDFDSLMDDLEYNWLFLYSSDPVSVTAPFQHKSSPLL